MTDAPAADAPDLYAFAPPARRAEELDANMHRELAASLRHVAEASADALPEASRQLSELAAAITAGRAVRPLGFATYFQIVDDIGAGRLEAAARWCRALAGLSPRPPGLTLSAYDAPAAAASSDMLRLRGLGANVELAPVAAATADAFFALFRDAFALLEEAVPDLHGELAGLVRELMVAQSPAAAPFVFDGASHYQFWGLLLLNPMRHRTPLAVAEAIAHEAGHSLLFGLTTDEPLVFNPDDELYPSPLRRDPRPMDGIYHATFVSARMAWTMARLAAGPVLAPDERDRAARAAASDRAHFFAGHAVVAAHGRLSSTGRRIMDNAYDAMRAAAF